MALKKSERAALYSAIIFPGAGLWWLNHYWRACIFIIPAGLSLWYITKCLWLICVTLRDRIINQTLPLDIFDLNRSVEIISRAADKLIADNHFNLPFAEYLLVAAWLCSIASSYFAGKKIEQAEDGQA